MATAQEELEEKLRRIKESAGLGSATASSRTMPTVGGRTTPTSVPQIPSGGLGVNDIANYEIPSFARDKIRKALVENEQRIMSDPNARLSGKQDELIAGLRKIAEGEKKDDTGLFGALGKALVKVGEGAMYALNRPLAAVTSVVKELSDIPSGDASFGDLISQAVAKDTTPSKYLAKTGVDWLDRTIGFAADIVADPLTYVTFGASAYAGRAGRLNLAAKAATPEVLAKAPSLIPKLENGSIVKLGEWALNAAEREAIGLPSRPGLTWTFGSKGQIGKAGTTTGKISEGAATIVGKNLAKGRAAISDTGLFVPFQKIITPKNVRTAGLTLYGRVAEDPKTVNRIAQLASLSSAVHSNGVGNFVAKKFGSKSKDLVKEIFDYEANTGRKLHEVVEGLRAPADDVERGLAERQRNFFDETFSYSNSSLDEFAARRNVPAQGIPYRQNYVPRVISDEARDALTKGKVPDKISVSSIHDMLGMSAEEFASGPGIMRARGLQTGDKWLGRTLRTNTGDGSATIREINDISKKVLGFNFFEEDSSKYMAKYLDSIVDQTKRVAFFDRLFDYGGDVVKAVTLKETPESAIAKQWQKTVDGFDNLMSPILEEKAKGGKDVASLLRPRVELADALSKLQPGSDILTPEQLGKVQRILDSTFADLDKGIKMLDSAPAEIRYTYETLFDAMKRNLDSTRQALTSNDQEELVGRLGLRKLYSRLFPEAEVPKDFRTLAEDIVDATEQMFGIESTKQMREAAQGIGDVLQNKLRADTGQLAQRDIDFWTKEMGSLPKGSQKAGMAEISRLKPIVDAAGSIEGQRETWDQTVGKVYGDNISKVFDTIANSPTGTNLDQMNFDWVQKTIKDLESVKGYGLQLGPTEADTLGRIVTQMKGLEANLAVLESERSFPKAMVDKFMSLSTAKKVSADTIKGWEAIENLGVQFPAEVRDALFSKVREIATPSGFEKVKKLYGAYTQFFTLSAMLSPGFVVRNSYTAALNNFVAGVSLADTREGLRFAKNIMLDGLDTALSKVPESKRGLYEQALKVTYATGAGQARDDILAPILRGKGAKLVNAPGIRHWSDANEAAEIAFRFSLGLSSLKKGLDFDSAVSQVARYHFDYGDLSRLDEVMKRFIPFWVFASRNIPLQIVNQVARPSVYRMYGSLQRNFGLTEEEMQDYPQWIKDRGPLRIPGFGPDNLFMPDLPQLDMQDQIRMMTDPMRLLSQANPIVKLSLELMGDRQYWSNIPFSEKKVPVRGPLDYPAYIGEMLFPWGGGQGKNPVTGERFTSSKAAYAVPNLIPTLAQLQRLFPGLGGKESYQDRATSSRASYFGLPFRRVSDQEKFNELIRRQFAMGDYLSELARRGFLKPKQ